MDAPEALREFLTYVVANLIDHPKEATIASGRSANGGLAFRVMLAPDDVRLVHGRNGMTASAIRSLLQTAAERHGLKVSLKIGSVRDEDGSEPEGRAESEATDDATAES